MFIDQYTQLTIVDSTVYYNCDFLGLRPVICYKQPKLELMQIFCGACLCARVLVICLTGYLLIR